MIQSASCAASKNLSSCLQIVGANPEKIGNQPAKTAQRDRRERQHRRRVFQHRRARQAELLAVAVQRLLHPAGTEEQRRRQQQQEDFFGAGVHWFPCAVASSRRLNNTMPMTPMMPPSSRTICAEGRAQFAPGDAAPAAQRINRRKIFHQIDDRQKALEQRDQHHVQRPNAP